MKSALRNSLLILFAVSCLFGATKASAQERNVERIRQLESRVTQLEGFLNQLHQRVSNLEYNQRPEPYPPVSSEVVCLITDSGYSKVFLGRGRMALEAEAAAREVCGRETHPSYCQASMKCSDPRKDQPINGAVCVITDSGYQKTFKGEGKSLVEAEYKVRKSCGDSVHPSYCTGSVRCDSY